MGELISAMLVGLVVVCLALMSAVFYGMTGYSSQLLDFFIGIESGVAGLVFLWE